MLRWQTTIVAVKGVWTLSYVEFPFGGNLSFGWPKYFGLKCMANTKIYQQPEPKK